MAERTRCSWPANPLDVAYHDDEWGVPLHDDTRLFEALILEGAQAGLSWSTILAKREGYRRAYRGFDPAVVARFDQGDVTRLVADDGIVRHRGKIEWSIRNAQALLAVQRKCGSFDAYIWSFVDGRTIVNRGTDRVASTALSERISADLKRRGFGFVGPTIVYAFMQAVGVVDDHEERCFRKSVAIPKT